jgi:RNA polymerase sigma-70 factor, ECF subfamily
MMSALVSEEQTSPLGKTTGTSDAAARVRSAVDEHHHTVWRALRRLGVAEDVADDAVQRVFMVFTRRADAVPIGKEKTFLLGVALRVAHETRRRRGVRLELAEDDALAAVPAETPSPDDDLDARRARATLDAILDAMPIELRGVFVLYEIEEMTMADIAHAMQIPAGTVASRLRRARELFGRLAREAQEGGAR